MRQSGVLLGWIGSELQAPRVQQFSCGVLSQSIYPVIDTLV